MFWFLLMTAAVFIAYRAFLVRARADRVIGTASVRAQRLPEGSAWRSGAGVWGLVLGPELERTLTAEVAEALLAVSWGVTDGADLGTAEATMRGSSGDRATWTIVRTATLVRLAVAGGVVSPDEGTSKLEALWAELAPLHTSWSSLGDAFAREHEGFLAEPPRPPAQGERVIGLARLPSVDQLEKARAWLEASVWPDLPLPGPSAA